MMKYQFLVFHQESEQFLELLKNTGVVHVKKISKEMDATGKELLRKRSSLQQSKKLYERLRPEQSPGNKVPEGFSPGNIQSYLEEYRDLTKAIPRLKEELYHIRHFGTYHSTKIEAIENRGLYFHLFSVGIGKIQEEWTQNYAFEKLFDAGRKSYFLILSEEPDPPRIKAQKESFPDKSMRQIQDELDSLQTRKEALEASFYHHENAILSWFETTIKGIDDQLQDIQAQEQMIEMGSGKVIYLSGWIPKKKSKTLEKTLDEEGFYYIKQKPKPADAPPILLNNRALGRWFEPISGLFDFPKYFELDLTPFFAPFFLLFFGFCLGDGGYGLLLFLVLLAIRPKVPKEYLKVWRLALALEFVAIFMGIISGSFFGINLFETEVPVLVKFRNWMLNPNELFTFALILGGIQIIFGLILRIINQVKQFGWLYMIAPLGWIVLLTSLALGYLQNFTTLLTVTSWTGVALIILFSDPKAKFGIRLGKGIWELYGISGFFGDLLSYIRLFALGLASSILGFVVNDIAMTIFDAHRIIGPVLGVLMLIIGHSLNIFIASLGAFVHPMRLTFVEFYKNAGFTGGGEVYKPLKKIRVKSNEL